ncbi:MAG: DUF1501 domain-containing protein, partial [Bacteroidota bacterium]
MLIKRKDFIVTGSLASASLMMPKFLKAFTNTPQQLVPKGNKVLVVLQLSGGNDGLNTVIPYRNDLYYKNRPNLAINKTEAIGLTDEIGLHPELAALANLYQEGNMSIINNVGYPNPDRSHFRSMDIWHSAANSNEYLTTGWIGRYLDAQCKGCDKPTQALELDDILSLSMKGELEKAIAFKDANRLYNTSQAKYFKALDAAHHQEHAEAPVDYLYKTMTETISSADYIYKQSKLCPAKGDYPKGDLGNSFRTIASLILSDINTKVYYVSLGSFDTHVGQQDKQKRLFKDMNAAIEAFTKDMKINNRFDDVLLMTFSEFGRRVAANASGGTDHGTANNMFMIGGGLKQKGILNPMPDLSDLQDGDLKYSTD